MDRPRGLLADPVMRQALLGYEGMPTPDAAEGMPQYDPGFWKRLGNAILTMPTVQAVKSGLTLPGDVYAGRQPMGLPSQTEDLSRVADLAGLAMTGGIAGVASGAVPKEAVGIFGGKLAKTADHAALAKAQAMERHGSAPSDIWEVTGWGKGPDGKWRFEIDDSASKFRSPSDTSPIMRGEKLKLSDYLQHDELAKAYPNIPDTAAQHIGMRGNGPLGDGTLGAYSDKTGYTFNEKHVPSSYEMGRAYPGEVADAHKQGRSTALHEAQHQVQDIEGFASGGSPDFFIRENKAALQSLEEKIAAINAEMKAASGTPRYHELMDERSALVEQVHVLQGEHGFGALESGHAKYKQLAGEVEARNVQHRADWTPEQRRDVPPWYSADIPPDQQILARHGGPQMSAAEKSAEGILAEIGKRVEPPAPLSGGLLGNREPIRAYHGSPHDFDRFDLSKIGTGEGAQAYGHGLYFAENEGTAKSYRDTLANPQLFVDGAKVGEVGALAGNPVAEAAHTLLLNNKSPEAAREYVMRSMERAKSGNYGLKRSEGEAVLKAIDEIAGKPVESRAGGRMYEVAIHADPERFLDWDKPLSGQSEAVQKGFGGIVERDLSQEPGWAKLTGQQAHNAAVERAGARGRGEAALREAGIPGIKYLDAGSRYHPASLPDNPLANEARQFLDAAGGDSKTALKLFHESNPVQRWAQPERDEVQKVIKAAANQQTNNYVLFSDDIVQILRKYGVASFAALPPAVQMAIQLSQEQGDPQPSITGKASGLLSDFQHKMRGPEPPATPVSMGIRG